VNRLFVWVRLADGEVRLAGELATTRSLANGRFESEFEYTQQWATTGFPLDPQSLPLKTLNRRFAAELFLPPLAIFDDALPDDWGRSLLAAAIKLEGGKPSPPEMLLRMRGGGTGALLFTATPTLPHPISTIQTSSLAELLDAAEKFEAGTLPLDDEFRRLVEGSSRAGGARPKALVHDASGEWLVKFPSARDAGLDVVALEAACQVLATRAGLETPESRLTQVGRRRALMVRRFDVTPQNGRVHMVSLRTLCLEHPGVYAQGYSDLERVVRRHSASPVADITTLFRHMVFNAAIGNVDDHLKNFWMLTTGKGYRVAPAFDLVPDISGRTDHTLAFHTSFKCPGKADLMTLAKLWQVVEAEKIIKQVAAVVSDFDAVVRTLKVRDDKALQSISADVKRRVNAILT
jgi:serine/threonine-protein kinase HipA